MICPACGHRNGASDAFCGGCQAFLDRDDPPAESTVPLPAVDPAPAPDPPAVPSPSALSTGPTYIRRPGDPTEPPETVSVGWPEGEPRPAVTPLAPPEEPGPPDRPCPHCRVANAHDRRLCRSCGGSLEEAPETVPVVPLPWWRRVFRRREQRLAAGYRPARRLWRRPRVALPVLVLVLACAGWFARAELTRLLDVAHDRSTKPAPLHPDRRSGSSQAPNHPAKAAFDGFANRYWSPAGAGDGVGQYLEAAFTEPVRLEEVMINPGCSDKEGAFLTEARPSRMTVTVYSADGSSTRRSLHLKDAAEPPQQFTVRGSDVVRVRLTVDADYGAVPGHRLAVAEVELFGRR